VTIATPMRQQILGVARLRFAEHGYYATSLTDIASEVGIRRPSLLHHFPSKEALYREVLVSGFADWAALVEDSVTDLLDGWPQVERVIRAAFQFFEEHPDFVRLIRHEALDGGPILSSELGGLLRPMFERAVGFLEREMDAGSLRRFDAGHLLLTGYGAALSWFSDAPLIDNLIDGDSLDPGQIATHRDQVLEIFRNALEP